MCGISGFSGSFEPAILEEMNAVMAHRGPDDSGVYHDEKARIGLAHRRLSIIDLSPLGHQPMWDFTDTVAITFNGEIYNYKELKRDLIQAGYHFRSSADTEVLVNLYIQYGSGMLEKLNGIFAFAIFDTRDNSLFLARDGAGVKPLYWTTCRKGFLFASELKALLLEPSVSRELNYDAVRYYVNYLWAPAAFTMLKDIHKLEPGCWLRVINGLVIQRGRFYDFPYARGICSDLKKCEAAEIVRDGLEAAVERQLVSDAPVGAFLSGGLDSSSIVALACRHVNPSEFNCFTVSTPGIEKEGFENDLTYASRAATHFGVRLNVIEANPDLISFLPSMIYHLDEPQADPAGILVYSISAGAKQRGVKVLLSGSGGDDVFAGYRRHRAAMLEPYWSWLPKTLRGLMRNISAKAPQRSPAMRRLRKAFAFADSSDSERMAGYFIWPDPSWEMTLYSQDCRSQFRETSVSTILGKSLNAIPSETHPLNKILYLDARHFLADHNHNYTDKMSMAAGVEVRVPFLDKVLMELAARMPPDLKLRRGKGKFILRKAMEGILPESLLQRSKTGFGAPVRMWFLPGVPKGLEELISTDTVGKRGLFDPEGVHRLICQNSRGSVDASYILLALICIELWLRTFVDKPVPEQVVLT